MSFVKRQRVIRVELRLWLNSHGAANLNNFLLKPNVTRGMATEFFLNELDRTMFLFFVTSNRGFKGSKLTVVFKDL